LTWRQSIAKAVADAQLVLVTEGHPLRRDTLREGIKGSFASVMAARVILFADDLQKAVKAGNIDQALNLFHEILSAWQDMDHAAKIPELNGWPIADVADDVNSAINLGLSSRRNLRGMLVRSNQERRASRQREWDQWNVLAASIKQKNPRLSKIEVARRVKKELGLTEHDDSIARRLET